MANILDAIVGLFYKKTPITEEKIRQDDHEEKEFESSHEIKADNSPDHEDPQNRKKKKSKLNWKICMKKKSKHSLQEKRIERMEELSKLPKLKTDLAAIRHMTPDVICPICLKFICQAVTSVCGHSFCDLCINEYLILAPVNFCDKECIICSTKIRGKKMLARCKRMDSLIDQ